MKFTNLVKSTLILVFTTLSLFSCNYILKNNDKITNEKTIRINVHKEEARLLLKASKNNLDILELCETLKKVEIESSIKQLAEDIEETHFEISKNYKDLAREELISIPNYSHVNNIEKAALENDAFVETHLRLILKKINKQMKVLDTLAETTNNAAFKVLVVKDSELLKSNIYKIENTLHKLEVST